ncbi:hypothetical protein T440DRAFT_480815 [Plenodomus tracheiphilus IPT5]|uniref:Uncharacterized protein n=1 Tax=Plenodomus tracheiphilus IPT5 TaxID=1408161 RepID=A0A6A7B2B4_9PLEO|nr:hypothetical protein T440DRAFT_480815 [Plenodomus tracheiphilus IPT5]
MDPSIASPMPMRFNIPQSHRKDFPSTDTGRDTPLPQYEKSQSASVPFTLNLQEDASNPGQFQLVINVGAKDASNAEPTTVNANAVLAKPSVNPPSTGSFRYETRKRSPPTSLLGDKNGWADLDNVTPGFLHKVVPEWGSKFARSDSSASTQSRKFADIKARIKKTGKGYVVRLLKGSAADPAQIAEVDLGGFNDAAEDHGPQELDSSSIRAELDSTQACQPPTIDTILGRPNVFEIGTSNESGIRRPQTTIAPIAPSSVITSNMLNSRHGSIRSSITEEGLSDAETLVPEAYSTSSLRISEQPISQSPRYRPTIISRSDSTSSIVKTPTRGLSVVGPVRRVVKNYRVRESGKFSNLDRPRSDVQSITETREIPDSVSVDSSSHSFEMAPLDVSGLRERLRSVSLDTHEVDVAAKENGTWHHPERVSQAAKPRHARRSSGHSLQTLPAVKKKLRLQTNVAKPSSRKSSPMERRKRSPRTHSPVSTSSSLSDEDDANQSHAPLLIPKADTSRQLREAVARALGQEASQSAASSSVTYSQALPVIIEPTNEEAIGEISLPSDLELRSVPADNRNMTLRLLNLAISALSDKAYEGFKILRDRYGAEPPVPPGHVRVRWECSCGESLYDDYIEQRPNAARLFEAFLNRPRAHTPRTPTSQGSSASSIASVFDISSRASTLATPSSTYGGSASWGKRSDTSNYSPTRIRSNNPFSVRMPTQVEESWLLTCANEGRLTPKVVHIDVNEGRVRSDKDLALALREHYDQLNSHWYSWARLRGLTTIEFVQFEVHRNRFADIRAAPSMPPKSATSSSTSPSPEKSESLPQHPYTFEPNDLLPPVGSTYLLHLFQHPSDYDGELITYLRSPKRRLRLETGMGWGVHLVEGFLAQKVWAVTMGVFGLGGAVFAILWAVKKHDVQGAFGIAQWVLGVAVLLLGGMQAWLE